MRQSSNQAVAIIARYHLLIYASIGAVENTYVTKHTISNRHRLSAVDYCPRGAKLRAHDFIDQTTERLSPATDVAQRAYGVRVRTTYAVHTKRWP
jgi:hypothetical protein